MKDDCEIRFAWDENKNQINQKKHGISFDEAKTVFYDEEALLISDDEHSIEEERFVLIGRSNLFRILVVCHCYRQEDEEIRIISARKANNEERKQYDNLIGRR